jgi:threonine synthase
VRYATLPTDRAALLDRWDMWRYAAWLPLLPDEEPVTLGEGATSLLPAPALAASLGVRKIWIKEEGLNPTGSFKARGMSAAVTRARRLGVPGLVVPTAGNAGAALAAYAAAAGINARVYAPADTPPAILTTIRSFGADLVTVEGHIGDAGKAAREFAAQHQWFDVSTLREPYRIEGKKTMGLEIAEQLQWRLPDVIVYPTGGGTGLIGMWKAFQELRAAGWIARDTAFPRMVTAQAAGCAPIVRAFEQGAACATAWENPETHASGLRVPSAIGDRLILRALRESGGDAAAANEDEIRSGTDELARTTGIDASPEGGCAWAVCRALVTTGRIGRDSEIVLFNTGAGASYRS